MEQYTVNPSLLTIDKIIRAFSYTLKRVSLIPERRNDVNTLKIRFDYAREFFTLLASDDGDNILFLDEVRFNISMRSNRGRAAKGQRAMQIVSRIRNRNISVYCVMPKCGIVHKSKQTCPFNRQSFLSWRLSKKFDQILKTYRACSKHGKYESLNVVLIDITIKIVNVYVNRTKSYKNFKSEATGPLVIPLEYQKRPQVFIHIKEEKWSIPYQYYY